MPHLSLSSPQYSINAFLESQANAQLDRYLDSIEDGMSRCEKEEPMYFNEE